MNTLRLWAARATRDFDLQFFNDGDYRRAVEEKIDTENISKVLYPNDQSEEGKELRLKQQYFFVACSIADIVRRYKRRHATFDAFPDKVAIQLNDTHPAIAVAELMRVLVDDETHATGTTPGTCASGRFGYTNHTLMPEALERWPVKLFERLLPRHLMIIYEINHRFMRQVQTRWPGDMDRMRRMSIIEEGDGRTSRCAWRTSRPSARTASTAWPRCTPSSSRATCCPTFTSCGPSGSTTRPTASRRAAGCCTRNPRADEADHVAHRAGLDRSRPRAAQDAAGRTPTTRQLLDELWQVKQQNKRDLAALVQRRTGVELPPDAMFVMQVKRIHEYKRQLLACLQIVAHYLALKRNPGAATTPRTYIFAGKAAPGYAMAKLHIKLINDVAAVINADPEVRGRMAVVFLPNYGVSLAQALIPAADVSLQISTAGKEASGHQQHEVRAQRRAHRRHARRRQRRDPRRGRPGQLLPVRAHHARGRRRCGRRATTRAPSSRAAPRSPRCWS